MATLGGVSGGRSSWGWRIGRSIERCCVRVCGSVVRCGFVCAGIVIFSIIGWPVGSPLSQNFDFRMRCEERCVRRM